MKINKLLESKHVNESISTTEPIAKFQGKISHTFTKDKKWEVVFDEVGNILARTRHGKPFYFKGHINDKVNDFPSTDEDNIILAAREQHGLKFGKKSVDEAFKPTESGIQSVKVYNPYNYTIQELRVDNDNKTFERGNFTAGKADKKTKNRQEYEDIVDSLKELGYNEIKSDYRSLRNKTRKGIPTNEEVLHETEYGKDELWNQLNNSEYAYKTLADIVKNGIEKGYTKAKLVSAVQKAIFSMKDDFGRLPTTREERLELAKDFVEDETQGYSYSEDENEVSFRRKGNWSKNESLKSGDTVYVKPSKRLGKVKSVKGDYVVVEVTGGNLPDRTDTYYTSDLEVRDSLNEGRMLDLYKEKVKTEFENEIDSIDISHEIDKDGLSFTIVRADGTKLFFTPSEGYTTTKSKNESVDFSNYEKSVENFLNKYGFTDERYPHTTYTKDQRVIVEFVDGIVAKDCSIMDKKAKEIGANRVYLGKKHRDSTEDNELWLSVEFEFDNRVNESKSIKTFGAKAKKLSESANEPYKDYIIKSDGKNGGYKVFNKDNELEDSGFKSIEDAKKFINRLTKDTNIAKDEKYKGYTIKYKSRNSVYDVYDKKGELEDHGFKTADKAKEFIDGLNESISEALNDYRFEVSCNDQPTKVIRIVAENEDKAIKYVKNMYAQEHTTYADDRQNNWNIKNLDESIQDTVTRYQVEYFIDENDDSDTPLETYVYTDSKQEAIAKVKEEYPNAQIVYCVSETVPAEYKEWDMNESVKKGTPVTLWWKDDTWSKTSPSYASCEYKGKTKDGKHKFVSDTYGWEYIVDFKENKVTTPQGKTFELDTSSGWNKRFSESINQDDKLSEEYQKEFYNGYVILKSLAGDGWDIYSYDGTPEKVTKAYMEDEGYATLKDAKAEIDKWVARPDLDEASYGGAFDIEDDQYFTREDLMSFADEVLNHVAETFNGVYDIGGVWFEDGKVITLIVNDSGDEFEDATQVDMRKVKEPWHLKRAYASNVAANIIQQIKDQEADVITESKEMNESPVVSSAYEFDDDVDELTYYYDDEVFKDNLENSPYTEIASKRVADSDGFMTDYTMYMNINTGEYVFVFGDKDIYSPEDGYFDWECETKEEADEWFDTYNGFDDSDDDIEWMYEDVEESPVLHKKPDGSYLVSAESGDGYTAYNKSDVWVGHISADNEQEAKNKFNANKFDESLGDIEMRSYKVTYYLPYYDDGFGDDLMNYVLEIEAPDDKVANELAVRHLRKMRRSANGEAWQNAKIVSIQ